MIDWGRGLALYTAPRAGAGRVAGLKSFAVRCELRGWLAARWAAAGSAELVARFPAVRGNSDFRVQNRARRPRARPVTTLRDESKLSQAA